MPVDSGNQEVTLKFYDPVDANEVNERQRDIIPTGVYKGGYLAEDDDTHVDLSPLVCEVRSTITSPYVQVKIETTTVVNVVVGVATPYVVMRWSYTGVAAADFGEMIGVATPAARDIIIGECTFSGATLTGFDYTERTNPEVVRLFCEVEPEETPSMYVRIRAGRYQLGDQTVDVIDQLYWSEAFTAPVSGSKTGAVYIDSTGSLEVSSDFNQAGELVLAEIILTAGQTEITADEIIDVRPFLTPPIIPDGVTVLYDANGKLKLPTHTHAQLHDEAHGHGQLHDEAHTHVSTTKYLMAYTIAEQIDQVQAWTKFDWNNTVVKAVGVTQSNSTFTLLAGVRYRIGYSVGGRSRTRSPRLRARFRVVSGDTSWNLEERSYTLKEAGIDAGNGYFIHLFWAGIIIPSSNTVIQLEGVSWDFAGENTYKNAGIFTYAGVEVDGHYSGAVT
jgi:hypothetical protein